MIRLVHLLVAAAAVACAQVANAATSAKAVVYNDGRIVYYYDDVNHSSDEGWVETITSMTTAKSPSATVTNIVIDSSFATYQPTTFASYFKGLSDAATIDGLQYLDTSNALYLQNMFEGCSSLTSLDVSSFNTAKVQYFGSMFYNCTGLVTIDVSSFSNAAMKDCGNIFRGCSSLTTIYANAGFNLGKVGGNYVFTGCSSLVGGNGTAYSSSNHSTAYGHVDVPSDPGYFTAKSKTLTINVSEFAEKHVADVTVVGASDGLVVNPDVEGGNVWTLDMGVGFNIVYTAESGYAFMGEGVYTNAMFSSSGIASDTVVSGESIPTAVSVSIVYTLTIDTTLFEGAHIESVSVLKESDGSLVEPEEPGVYRLPPGLGFTLRWMTSPGYLFGNYVSVTNDLTFAETGMCSDAEVSTVPQTIRMVQWNSVKGVISTDDSTTMTFYCDADAHGGVVYARQAPSGFPSWSNLSTVKRIVLDRSMQSYVPQGDGFQYFFYGLSSVTNIEGLSNLRTRNGKKFHNMFYNCRSLTELDLSRLRTTNATHFGEMFMGCSSLRVLDISRFSSPAGVSCGSMFRGCSSLVTIYANRDFRLGNGGSTDYMFNSCVNLVGGCGTKAVTVLQDYSAYAHVDEPGNPGYFTLKPLRGCCLFFK